VNEFSVRYLVDDVRVALDFYRTHLGFETRHETEDFALLTRGALTLQLSGPASSAGQALADGRIPSPGGWNRIQLAVDDLDAAVTRLRRANTTFRTEIVQGRGGPQVLVEDPSGNPVGLYEPR
jgi:catechol 2,3-dioxygenase-like lactoylglutathione lyase family enzyme